MEPGMGEHPTDGVGKLMEVSLDLESLGLEASAWFVKPKFGSVTKLSY
jgi:hypothetical protein